MEKRKTSFETEVIHGTYDPSEHQDSLTTPIYQTSTFTFQHAVQGEERFAANEPGYIYSRLGNPTVTELENRIAAMEGGEKGLAFASGMAAVSAVLFALAKAGDHILVSRGIYGCTFGFLTLLEEKYNVTHDFSDLESEEEIRKMIKPNTRLIYLETPINPTMQIIDIRLVVKVAKEHGIPVVVDNTFSSPYLQRPLELGCDVVIHSATKYIGGHGDVIAGLVAGRKEFLDDVAMTTRKDIGGVLGPFDAWLLLRGIKTLPIRMDRHCDNAEKLAGRLKQHPAVEKIIYPGDRSHPQYDIAEKQMAKPGGLISFIVKGGKKQAQELMDRLELIKIAVSLGDPETLIQHPATMTHAVVPEEDRMQMGIPDNMLRLSVGLESWEDLWEDLKQALDGMK